MKKTVYHGSDHIIERPKYGYGKIYNDYGVGFYCTENQNMAKEWGVSADKNGYANRYEIECDGLKVLNLNMRDYTMLHWLTILLENREFDASTPLAAEAKEYLLQNFHLDYEKADIIIGYRADDSYFSFAADFINGAISYRQLSNAMRLGKLGQQFVLKSRRAFERLEQGMRLQVCRNGIRGKHPVIIWRVGNILIWNETAVSGVIYISPQF